MAPLERASRLNVTYALNLSANILNAAESHYFRSDAA
jgi:hypothetical protein